MLAYRFERYAISVRAGRLLPIEECRNFKNEADWRQLCIEGEKWKMISNQRWTTIVLKQNLILTCHFQSHSIDPMRRVRAVMKESSSASKQSSQNRGTYYKTPRISINCLATKYWSRQHMPTTIAIIRGYFTIQWTI